MSKSIFKYTRLSVIIVSMLLLITFGCEKEEALIITPISSIQININTGLTKIHYPDEFKARLDIEIVDGNIVSDSIRFIRNTNAIHQSSGNIEVPINKRFVMKLYTNLDDTDLFSVSDTIEISNDDDEIRIVKMFFSSGEIIVTKPEVTSLTTTSAVFTSEITDNGGSEITSRGFIVEEDGATTSPDYDIIEVSGNSIGEFTGSTNSLTLGTTYTVYAFVETADANGESGIKTFTTLSTTGVVNIVTSAATAITPTSAEVSASFADDGAETFVEKGFVWATFSNPDLTNNEGITFEGAGSFTFTSTISELFESTTYYVRAYATNDAEETFYSNEITFSTVAFITPSVETVTFSDVFLHTAVFEGNVSDEGNMPVVSKGVVYNTVTGPTIEVNLGMSDVGAGGGIFETQINGLESGTMYYARTYAQSEAGVSYGSEISFTTLQLGGNGPAGGIIFYDDGVSGGLEVSIVDYEVNMQWGCGTLLINSNATVVGSGVANTQAIVDAHNNDLVDYAANPTQCDASNDGTVAAIYCDEFILNDYDDWFLPSLEEVMLIYSNLHSVGLGDFTDDIYWTSTEESDQNAKSVDLWKGMEIVSLKTTSYRVRPVRKF